MTNLEKVKTGLRACSNIKMNQDVVLCNAEECPYCDNEGGCMMALARDALQAIIDLEDAPVENLVKDQEETRELITEIINTVADNGFRPSIILDEFGITVNGWPMTEPEGDGEE